MVYYFNIEDYLVYMGKDKFENEDLIKYAWPEDVWFHADSYSSAHVYIRLKENQTIDDLSKSIIQKMCQLTKANSIEGNKRKQINIIYTMASNLKKTSNMEVGSVSYYKPSLVKHVYKVQKDTDILKPIQKTKKEEFPNLQLLKQKHEEELFKKEKILQKQIDDKKKEEAMKEKQRLHSIKKDREDFQDYDEDDDSDSDDNDDFIQLISQQTQFKQNKCYCNIICCFRQQNFFQ